MAATAHAFALTVTKIQLDVSPEQAINVRSFLRGLKRPVRSSKEVSGRCEGTPSNLCQSDSKSSEAPAKTIEIKGMSLTGEDFMPYLDASSLTARATDLVTRKGNPSFKSGDEPTKTLQVLHTYRKQTEIAAFAGRTSGSVSSITGSQGCGFYTTTRSTSPELSKHKSKSRRRIEKRSVTPLTPQSNKAVRAVTNIKKKRRAPVKELALVVNLPNPCDNSPSSSVSNNYRPTSSLFSFGFRVFYLFNDKTKSLP